MDLKVFPSALSPPSAAFSLAHQLTPPRGHDVPVLPVGNQHAEGQGDLSLVRAEAAKRGAKLLSPHSAQGALALIALLLPN